VIGAAVTVAVALAAAGAFAQTPTPVDFVAPPLFSSQGNFPISIASGYLNGDGNLDLAVVNNNSGKGQGHSAGSVQVLLGDGTGGFSPLGTPIVVGNSPVSVAIGDLNGDSKSDLVVANSLDAGLGTVSVLLGKGDGTFGSAPASPLTVGMQPNSVKVGDLNGDSKPDLVVANLGSNTVSVLLGNGDGTFASAPGSPVTVGNAPASVAIGDFNRDGKRDLAVANRDSSTVSVLLGHGDGTFAQPGLPIPEIGRASCRERV